MLEILITNKYHFTSIIIETKIISEIVDFVEVKVLRCESFKYDIKNQSLFILTK